MKIKLTKSQIKKMIRNVPLERLESGSWMEGSRFRDTITQFSRRKHGCCECMVGGIVRQVLLPSQRVNCISEAANKSIGGDSAMDYISDRIGSGKGIAGIRKLSRKTIREASPMASLVMLFDAAYDHYDVDCNNLDNGDIFAAKAVQDAVKKAGTERRKKLRDECLSFVEKHFPSSIVVDIGDVKPANGIRIVEP